MGTPHKINTQHMESPYARHMQQYPSQTEGYVPMDFPSKSKANSSTPSKQNYQGNNYNNYQPNYNNRRRGNGNNRYFNVNRGAGSGGNNSGGGGGGYQNNYQNNYHQQHQTNRHSNSGNRQQPYYGQKFNKDSSNSKGGDYYHPSMLHDPWRELLERHNAIKNSQIDVPDAPAATSQSPPPDQSPKGDESSSHDEGEDEQKSRTSAILEKETPTSISQ